MPLDATIIWRQNSLLFSLGMRLRMHGPRAQVAARDIRPKPLGQMSLRSALSLSPSSAWVFLWELTWELSLGSHLEARLPLMEQLTRAGGATVGAVVAF
jgi:hypothetical protein